MSHQYYRRINGKSLWISRIQLDTAPAAPVLVFLHEGLGCIELWKDFPQRLCEATGLNGMLYDRVGYGQSDPITEKRSVNYMRVDALEILPALLEEEGIENPILVGHSDGGTIALIYGAHFPVRGIITEAAHVKVEDETAAGIAQTARGFHLFRLKDRLAVYHGEKTETTFFAWADTWLSEEFRNWNIEHVLPGIEAPTLVIQGDKDAYATPQHVHDIVNGIGLNATPLFIENCGHNPHKEAPDVVLNAMSNFILSLAE